MLRSPTTLSRRLRFSSRRISVISYRIGLRLDNFVLTRTKNAYVASQPAKMSTLSFSCFLAGAVLSALESLATLRSIWSCLHSQNVGTPMVHIMPGLMVTISHIVRASAMLPFTASLFDLLVIICTNSTLKQHRWPALLESFVAFAPSALQYLLR
ncbi:hypothetical protein EDD18DRAFT_146618 [Armillaria luteobubalina]|uniref:Uncharacterized protein n=1 Tax=Armillaria luteobubalina TaxID=153913 RepID=A0AA39Q6L2_9AGAR|nr:hypothetical protein EDD18DRAFT_146618 [Armillaria luteobubalina]